MNISNKSVLLSEIAETSKIIFDDDFELNQETLAIPFLCRLAHYLEKPINPDKESELRYLEGLIKEYAGIASE